MSSSSGCACGRVSSRSCDSSGSASASGRPTTAAAAATSAADGCTAESTMPCPRESRSCSRALGGLAGGLRCRDVSSADSGSRGERLDSAICGDGGDSVAASCACSARPSPISGGTAASGEGGDGGERGDGGEGGDGGDCARGGERDFGSTTSDPRVRLTGQATRTHLRERREVTRVLAPARWQRSRR